MNTSAATDANDSKRMAEIKQQMSTPPAAPMVPISLSPLSVAENMAPTRNPLPSKVRGSLSIKGVRRAPINEASVEPDDNAMVRPKIPKTASTRSVIAKALRNHYLFNSLEAQELEGMIDVMAMVTVQGGENVITQGSMGDCFFVLECGQCDIIVDGKLVGKYASGDAFGELALLYNSPRAATIQATTGSILWTVDRTTFRKIMATTASATQLARVNFLKNVELLQRLSTAQLQKVAAALKLQRFKDGEYIIRQGETGKTFYIIVEGSVKCTSHSKDPKEADKELMTLGRGNYFGEMALMLNEPRQANCVAVGNVDCYVMDQAQFTKLLGPLRTLIDRQMRIRVLRSVPLLSSLSDGDLDVLAHALNVVTFEDGSVIIKEGTPGDSFYMISDGKVSVRKAGFEMMQLRSGEFFGERALLSNDPRAADCIAVGRVECLTLQRNAFEKLLGKLEHLMEREKQRQQMMQESLLGVPVPKMSVPTAKKIAFQDLEKIRTIGAGTFGRVYIARHKMTGETYALKCMQKTTVVETNQQKNVVYEKGIIAECDHPFILKLVDTFSDANQLYMLLELVQGGELWSLLYEKAFRVGKGPCGGFNVDAARFYAANVAESLRYLQKLEVAYRDLKPENLVMDSDGYLKMVDFGFAKHVPFYRRGMLFDRSFTMCGTPEYLAPELVLNKGHGKAVDHWALGCLIYELIVGETPFHHRDQNKIFQKIVQGRGYIRFHSRFDPDAKDLVLKLLEPNPALRLGSLAGGMNDVLEHPFFAKIDMKALVSKTIKAPYVPVVKGAMDTGNFEPYAEDQKVRPFHGKDVFEGF